VYSTDPTVFTVVVDVCYICKADLVDLGLRTKQCKREKTPKNPKPRTPAPLI